MTEKVCQVCGRKYRKGEYRYHCDTYYHNSNLRKNKELANPAQTGYQS